MPDMGRFGALALLALALGACVNDDTDFGSLTGGGADYELRDVEFDTTPLSETDSLYPDDNDYHENSTFARTVTITFDGDTATVATQATGVSATIDGAHVTINTTRKGVSYVVRGSTADGGLKIYSRRKFMLTLDGADITNTTGAAINNQCGKSMYVVLADGTTNSLADGSTYLTPASEDEKGALFSEGQIIFSGKGTLDVTAVGRNGIASDDYIVFRPGVVVGVTATARNCIKANDGVTVRGGVLNLMCSAQGGKGVNSEAFINISGGRLTAITTGGAAAEDGDTTGVAALKCDSDLVMTGGVVRLKCSGDGAKGVNTNGNLTVAGGQLTAEATGTAGLASPKGVKADGAATFSGGDTYAYSANAQPLDAASVVVDEALTATYSNDRKLLEIKP